MTTPATCPTTGRPLVHGLPVPWVVEWSAERAETDYKLIFAEFQFPDSPDTLCMAYDDPNPLEHTFGPTVGFQAQRDEFNLLWHRNLPAPPDTGTPRFATLHAQRQRSCMIDRRCQVCARHFDPDEPVTFLLAYMEQDKTATEEGQPLPNILTATPPTCLTCIPISMATCPHQATEPRQIVSTHSYEAHSVLADVYGPQGLEAARQHLALDDPALLRAVAKQLFVAITDYTATPLPHRAAKVPAPARIRERTPSKAGLYDGTDQTLTYLNGIYQQVQNTISLYRKCGLITPMQDGHRHGWEFHPRIAPLDQERLLLHSSYTRVYDLWRETPTCYPVHPHLVTEISRYRKTRLPTTLLDQLPHENPLLLFPEPITVLDPDGPALLRAIFITGLHGANLCSTHDPHRDGIRLFIITGDNTTHSMVALGLDATGSFLDPAKEAERAAAHLASVYPDITHNDHHRSLISKTNVALSLLMYLFAKNVDLVRAPAQHQPKVGRPHRRAPRAPQPTAYEYGWREGPDLFALRTRYEHARRTNTLTGLGGTLRPHPRVGYLGLRHMGPGRTIADYVAVRPTYIHRDRAFAEGLPTIVNIT